MEAESFKILESHVRRAWDTGNHHEQWRNRPEIPDKAEIMPLEEEDSGLRNNRNRNREEGWNEYQKDPIYNPKLPKNIVNGPWPSKEEYISAHYQILREDAIAPLRESVKYFRAHRNMDDDSSTCVYTHVHFKGLHLGPLGAAFKIQFSTERAGKQIRWQQSKRLLQGTIVALSPASDMFEKVCKIAIVAARPIIDGLDQNPPMIDLFWGDHMDAVFDPVETYVMIEARSGYFEAYRHVLVGLQKLRTERFTLANHIVNLDLDVGPPRYLEEHPILDLSSPTRPVGDASSSVGSDDSALQNVNVLEHFPLVPNSGMDTSQTSALQRIITKSVAVVQGPPGTGKTFTSVSSLKILLNNLRPEDPPVIIAAQTNHALDQLIKHVQVSEESVVRLGGRCDRENVDIIKRTLYELRKVTKDVPNGAKGLKNCKTDLEVQIHKIQHLMSPFLTEAILTDEILLKNRLITEDQKESLYEPGWLEADQSQGVEEANTIAGWLGKAGLTPIPRTPQINLGLPLEEADLEFEQLQELEHELEGAEFQEDRDREALYGKWFPFVRDYTGRASATFDDRRIRKMLASHDNLYDIPETWRGSIYRYWEKQLSKDCLAKLKPILAEYQRVVEKTKITKWHCNIKLIRHLGTKLIGCTTTGLSKYRPLLAALRPRTLLIEEAAETLEGSVMAGIFDSLEHLILVGDHKQLQAHCNVKALEAAPFHMGVSLFERLISNAMGFTMLNTQRRMISDIRKLLCIKPEPFYPELHDHPSVEDRVVNRAPVPGMGGKDSYFFHHNWPETRGTDSSRHNQDEAEMIVGFFHYLVLNGIKHSNITVLTFYNGQRKTILKELKKHPSLGANTYFNVFTVDSYQGEENDIILLSLVRSNDSLGIGFLESRNRLVVALSRARRGLYLFGNAITLTAAETSEVGIGRDPLWTPVINFMKAQGRFHLDGGFPITCTNHGTTISLMEADEWLGLAGGCDEDCGGILPCGHDCPLKCHPFEHSMVLCRVACPKTMECGHGCSYFCDEACGCTECEKPEDIPADIDYMAPITRDYRGSLSNATGDIRYGSNPSNAGTAGSYSKASSKKVAFSIPGSENQPPYGSGGNSEHGKYDPMPGKSRSGKPSFMNPNVASQRSGAGTAEKWQNWDPKKADADLAEKVRQMEAEQPTVDRSTLVFKDTWRPVVVENGVRSVSGPERKFIRRFGINNQSPAKPGPDTPDDADIADIRSQMTGFSFSHQYPTRAFAAPGLPATDLNDLIGLELSAPPGHAADPGPPPPTGADAASAPRDVVTAPVMMDESENLIDFDDDPSPIFPTPQAALVDLGDLLG